MSPDDNDTGAFALLIIDVQKDFWREPMSMTLPAYEHNVAALLDLCRRQGIDVIHLRALFRRDQSDWMVKYRLLGRIPCIAGSAGAEVLPCAAALPQEKIISKQSYDGFFNNELARHLQENGKRYLLVAGLVTSVCVLLTAASAAQRGFLVSLVEDCCADSAEAHGHTLEAYPFVFGRTGLARILADLPAWRADIEKIDVE